MEPEGRGIGPPACRPAAPLPGRRGTRQLLSVAVGLILLAVATTACTSSGIPTPATPTLAITLTQMQRFFDANGGGGWMPGKLTGGIVGYADGGSFGKPCRALMGAAGTKRKIEQLYVTCITGTNASVVPQIETFLRATVQRVAPAAATWFGPALDAAVTSPTPSRAPAYRVAKGTYVSVQVAGSPGQNQTVNVEIAPEAASPLAVHAKGSAATG